MQSARSWVQTLCTSTWNDVVYFNECEIKTYGVEMRLRHHIDHVKIALLLAGRPFPQAYTCFFMTPKKMHLTFLSHAFETSVALSVRYIRVAQNHVKRTKLLWIDRLYDISLLATHFIMLARDNWDASRGDIPHLNFHIIECSHIWKLNNKTQTSMWGKLGQLYTVIRIYTDLKHAYDLMATIRVFQFISMWNICFFYSWLQAWLHWESCHANVT